MIGPDETAWPFRRRDAGGLASGAVAREEHGMLSNRSRYALRAMIHLASLSNGGPATIGEIAAASNAPRKFLEAILLDLRRQDLLVSRRGRTGGYALARPAETISFADVIRALEGPLALAPCASRTAYQPCETCPDAMACLLRPVLSEGRDAVAAVFERRTLAEAAQGLIEPAAA